MGKKKPPAKPKDNGRHTAYKPLGCYVLSVSMENVRCFGKKQTLDCSDGEGRPRQWTVILGDNGTGKTTLLQAIAGHEWVERTARKGVDLDPSILMYSLPFIRQSTNAEPGRSELRAARQPNLQSNDGSGAEGSWEIRSPLSSGYRSNLRDFAVHGYGPNRGLVGATGEMSSLEFLARSKSASLFYRNVGLRDPEQLLLNLDHAARLNSGVVSKALLSQVVELLTRVLPEIEEVGFEGGRGVFPQPLVKFLTPYGWVPLRQLGHGYQTMIAWVVDFVSRMVERYPESDNPLAEPAVCLVDEIDLHLHPVWQRKVIGYLSDKFPNTQFIVTAHSPLVVQAAASADANIAVLVRSEEKDADGNHYVEIRNNPEDVRNWRLDQILTSDLFGGLSLNPPKVEVLFKEKEHLAGLKRPTPVQKARLVEIEAEWAKLPVGDDAREVKEMQAIREALDHLQKHSAK